MKLVIKLFAISFVLVSTACTQIPHEAYSDQWKAEALLDVASESVNIDLGQRNAMAQLVNMTNANPPASATLYCSNMRLCERAGTLLESKGVPFEIRNAETNVASLNFERVVARDCESRFITNHINPYNLHHPTFGCASAVNTVQMIRDKRQITDPLILGSYDGFKATQNYDSYQAREFDDRIIQVEQESVIDN